MTAPTGTLAAEAVQLLDAITDRLTTVRSRAGAQAGSAGPDADAEPGESDAEPGESDTAPAGIPSATACPHCGHDPAAASGCHGCPVCATLAVLRGQRPETTARLTDAALTIVQVLRSLLASNASEQATAPAGTGETSAQHGGPEAPDGPSAGGRAPGEPTPDQGDLQRIDIR